MNWLDTAVLGGILFIFILNLVPIWSAESETWISFVNYTVGILAIAESYMHKQWKFISLICVTLGIHLITDSCLLADTCITGFENVGFEQMEKYFTLYSILHLFSYVSLDTLTTEVMVPLLVLCSLIAVNLEIQSLVVFLIGIILFVNLILKNEKYYMEDIIAFCVLSFLACLFYFLQVDANGDNSGNGLKRFFVFTYFLSFSISTGIKEEGVIHSLRLFPRLCGQFAQAEKKQDYKVVGTSDTPNVIDIIRFDLKNN